MWTYTAYVIYKLSESSNELIFDTLQKFFQHLWTSEKVKLYTEGNELRHDLEYLETLGLINLNGTDKGAIRIQDLKKFENLPKIIHEESGTLLDEYTKRIDRALQSYKIP